MFTIAKQFSFSASHQLDYLPENHPCSHLHGHNYIVEIVLSSPTLNGQDFVLDYNDLQEFGEWINKTLDHQHLNDVLPCRTTAENIAQFLYRWSKERWSYVAAVKVSETPKTWAVYEE